MTARFSCHAEWVAHGVRNRITNEEVALGFEVVEHLTHGRMVIACIGTGLRAVKMVYRDVVVYAICDESMIMLYEPAPSIFDLRRRFNLGVRKTA